MPVKRKTTIIVNTKQNKSKNKNKNKNKKKKSRNPSSNSSRNTNSAALNRLTRSVCSITDPFCDAANGAQYPDKMATPTFPYQNRTLQTLTTNASGNGSVIYLPAFVYNWGKDSTMTDPNNAVYTTLQSSTSGLGFQPTKYRIVSWGIRIKSVAAPLNASGMVRIRAYNADGDALAITNCNTYRCAFAADIPLHRLSDTCIISRTTSPIFNQFSEINLSSSMTDFKSTGWTAINVSLAGGPASTSPIIIESIYNFECIYDDTTDASLLMRSSPPTHPLVTDVSNTVMTTMSGVFEKGAEYVEKTIWNMASKTIRAALVSVVPGAGAALALTVD